MKSRDVLPDRRRLNRVSTIVKSNCALFVFADSMNEWGAVRRETDGVVDCSRPVDCTRLNGTRIAAAPPVEQTDRTGKSADPGICNRVTSVAFARLGFCGFDF